MGGHDAFDGLPRDSVTREDVILRYAIARDQPYEYDVLENENSTTVTVTGTDKAAVTVTPGPEGQWCTCSEDAVPGTCTHVLFLLIQDAPIADTIRDNLHHDRQLVADEIDELKHTLAGLEQTKAALEEVSRLVESGDTQPF